LESVLSSIMQRCAATLYLALSSHSIRFYLRPLLRNLDDSEKRRLVAHDPLGLLVMKEPDEAIRRYTAERHSTWLAFRLHKEPTEISSHPNLRQVRLFAFQHMLSQNPGSNLDDIVDLTINDEELLWSCRAFLHKSKRLLRSRRLMSPKSTLLDELLSTTQQQLEAAAPVPASVSDAEKPSIHRWLECVHATLLRYCAELKQDGSPKQRNNIARVMQKITERFLCDPCLEPRRGRLAYPSYYGFHGLVFAMAPRDSLDTLRQMYQWQGDFVAQCYLDSDVMQSGAQQLMERWAEYWLFTIDTPALTKAWNWDTRSPYHFPLPPYRLIRTVLADNTKPPASITVPLQRLFRYALQCATEEGLTLQHFGQSPLFVVACALPYIKDARLSGLSASDQVILEDAFRRLLQ
jgi:hypothetical protein